MNLVISDVRIAVKISAITSSLPTRQYTRRRTAKRHNACQAPIGRLSRLGDRGRQNFRWLYG